MMIRSPLFVVAGALAALLGSAPAQAQKPRIIGDVRALVHKGNWATAETALASYKKEWGETPAYLEALSWIGRGRLANKEYEAAQQNATEVRSKAIALLKTRKLDDEPSLPVALGAAIEVEGQALNAQGRKSEAVAFLRDELKRWQQTSIRTRIQKNLHLVDLKGKPAPALQAKQWLGPAPPSSMRGKPTLLFFWAHWCSDCKSQGPDVGKLLREFGPRGLRVIAPTQTFGYVQGGEDAPRDKEVAYIETIRKKYYADLEQVSVPLSEENFTAWGCSTTPTLALLDRAGIVRLYRPGRISYEELKAEILPLLRN